MSIWIVQTIAYTGAHLDTKVIECPDMESMAAYLVLDGVTIRETHKTEPRMIGTKVVSGLQERYTAYEALVRRLDARGEKIGDEWYE